jgi:4-amino-4-deoxy-L-arabinose transferase-like glycosyltransferase
MKSIKELFLIVFLALLIRIPWMFLVPHIEAPDENTHFWVIKFIVSNLRLPDYHAVMSVGPEAVYGSIPQLGYLPHILFLKVISGFVTVQQWLYAARLGSVLMGLIVVIAAYYIGQILFAPNRFAALALPLMVTFHPQFVFVTSYINNDATAAALSAVILLLLINALKTGLNRANMIYLSIGCSWLILSKYSGYCVLITTFIILLLVVYLHRNKLKEQFILLGCMALIILFLTSWWFIRNYFQFGGDITGVKTMHSIWTLTYHRYLQSFASPIGVVLSTRFWRMLFFSFWGWFGYMTRDLPRLIYYGYLIFVILASLCFIRENFKHKISQPWLVLIVCFAINLAVCVYGTYSGVAGPQGRYLFPSEIPIMAMLIAGLGACQNNWSRGFLIVLVAFNVLAYCYSSFFLYRLYS